VIETVKSNMARLLCILQVLLDIVDFPYLQSYFPFHLLLSILFTKYCYTTQYS